MDVIASFYRGHVDPAYRNMMKDMIDSGLFDEFIAGVLQGLVYGGIVCYPVSSFALHLLTMIEILFLGKRNSEYVHGIQTVATEFSVDDTQKDSWSLVNQFLGKPDRARLTYFETRVCLDFYFP